MKNHTALALIALVFGFIIVSASIGVSLLLSAGRSVSSDSSPAITFSMKSEHCIQGERLNETFAICVPDCSKSGCELIETELRTLGSAVRTLTGEQHSLKPVSNMRTLVRYTVTGSRLSAVFKQETTKEFEPLRDNRQLHEELWKSLVRLLPESYLRDVSELHIMSDGPGSLTSMVIPDPQDPLLRIILIDIKDWSSDRGVNDAQVVLDSIRINTAMTVMHPSQVSTQEDCTVSESDFVCAADGSILSDFAGLHWSAGDYETAAALEDIRQPELTDARYAAYLEKRSNFVNPYAVTSPEYDLAETMTEFVIGSRPSNERPVDRKVLFLYTRPEMLALRDFLRGRIASQ
ncbi:MAG: hypothetical protein TR69_WS6001000298 [candidate division WS6 bacterium OLB20]|uniref:Uncharacterized protein n=1 Tax=candidate division WS6 bacterium OLB20 TaxID=1617426 RepID=A0A136M0J9_9BACT|nr:MAG: hypothetical protein TR69_WS6001000298 [candidate division WS6 bacterium OLB20]